MPSPRFGLRAILAPTSQGRNVPDRRILPLLQAAFVSLLLAGAGPAAAQQGRIEGRVVDAVTLEPLSGARVLLPDAGVETVTGEGGRYRLVGVRTGEVRLSVRLIGYRDATRVVRVRAGEATTSDFRLSVSAVSLRQLVVTATGQRRKRELGNAISTVAAAGEIEKAENTTLLGLLQGRATGVSVLRSSGSVGSASSIKIRGASSIGLDDTPLVYVDGARVDNDNQIDASVDGQQFSRLNDLNPEDIASIEVVKGPAAATLYGTEAAAGVIRVTTKSGTPGGTRWTLKGEYGGNWDDASWPDVVWNPRSFGFSTDTLWANNLLEDHPPFVTGDLEAVGGTVRGGVEHVSYYASAQRSLEEGNLPNNRLERISVRGNFRVNPSAAVDLSVNQAFTSSFATLPDNDNSDLSGGYIGTATFALPWVAPVTIDGVATCPLNAEIARAAGLPLNAHGPAGCLEPGAGLGGVTFGDLGAVEHSDAVERYTGSGSLTYRPFDAWTARVTLGYDQHVGRRRDVVPVDPERPFGAAFGDLSDGFLRRQDRTARNLTVEGNTTVTLDLSAELTAETTLGAQYFRETTDATMAEGRVFPAGSPAVSNSASTVAADFFEEVVTAGFFVQEQLSWRDRLFVTPAVRFDDNSAFGRELGLEAYPRVSASYSISDEPWLPGLFEVLKLRAAWGESGKHPGSNDALTLLSAGPVVTGGDDVSGLRPLRPGNPELRPERGREWELGFDASVLGGRLGLEFTYYDQTTADVLVQRPVAPSLGYPGDQWANIAEMTNTGIEVGLDAVAVDRPDLGWDWRLNFSTNENLVADLGLEQPLVVVGSFRHQRHATGRPFASYVSRPITVPAGCEDAGCAVVGEERFLGHPTPEWYGSASTTLTLFGNVTLHASLDFAGGHQLLNSTDGFSCQFGICPDLFLADPDGTFSDEALSKQAAAGLVPASVGPFVRDADFARLRTVSVQFDLPRGWAGAFGGESASFSLVAENLATFTGYPGMDPEISSRGGASAARNEFLTLPPARRVLGTLSVTF